MITRMTFGLYNSFNSAPIPQLWKTKRYMLRGDRLQMPAPAVVLGALSPLPAEQLPAK